MSQDAVRIERVGKRCEEPLAARIAHLVDLVENSGTVQSKTFAREQIADGSRAVECALILTACPPVIGQRDYEPEIAPPHGPH